MSRALGGELEPFGGTFLEQAGTPMRDVADRIHASWSVEDKDILHRYLTMDL